MSIKRYTLFATLDTPDSGPLVAPKLNVIGQAGGEWVKYEDHVAEVERLRELVARLENFDPQLVEGVRAGMEEA